MQPPVIMAFRKRLKSFGYKNVSIKQKIDKDKPVPGFYVVTANEPLAGVLITAEYTTAGMHIAFR